MRISIIGFSGSGKSTLAKNLSVKLNIPVLYLDKVLYLKNWEKRELNLCKEIVYNFIQKNKYWVIDGNYFKFHLEERMKISDKIIFLNFNRIICLIQAFNRYNEYKGKTRESISDGCEEKFDFEFIKWIVYDSRKESRINILNDIIEKYRDKVIICETHDDINKVYNSINID